MRKKMLNEKYSITVDKDNSEVLFHGYFSVRELLGFIEFYQKQGFNYVVPGDENSALCLVRKEYSKATQPEDKPEEEEELSIEEIIEKVFKDLQKHKTKQDIDAVKEQLDEIHNCQLRSIVETICRYHS